MFTARFFNPRAFAARYFPKVGADPTTSVGTMTITRSAPTITITGSAPTITIEAT